MMNYFKFVPWRSNKHAQWMAEQPCPICESLGYHTLCGYQGHHEGFGFGEKPMGGKYPDIQRLPLCWTHHAEREAFKGHWEDYYKQYGVNPFKLMVRLVNNYLVERKVK